MKTSRELKSHYVRALEYCQRHVSSETGFVHYNYEEPKSTDTIPLFDNLCFALALLKSHQSELMLEARELLKKLLPFQNEDGLFPAYMHEYPRCKRPQLGILQFAVMTKIKEEYLHLLGKELKDPIEQSFELLKSAIEGVITGGVRSYLKDALQGLEPQEIQVTTTREMGELILANDILDRPTKIDWHRELELYVGPLENELQEGSRPQLSVLDLLMKEDLYCDSPVALFIVLLSDPQLVLNDELTGDVHQQWMENAPPMDKFPKGFHNFRLATENHTLVVQERAADIEVTIDGTVTTLFVTYPEIEFKGEDNEIECSLFVNLDPVVDLTVDGAKATMFYEGEGLELAMDSKRFRIVHSVYEGEGAICGHTARGNRRAQIATDAKTEWRAYDWQIAYRTLRRTPRFVLKLTIEQLD